MGCRGCVSAGPKVPPPISPRAGFHSFVLPIEYFGLCCSRLRWISTVGTTVEGDEDWVKKGRQKGCEQQRFGRGVPGKCPVRPPLGSCWRPTPRLTSPRVGGIFRTADVRIQFGSPPRLLTATALCTPPGLRAADCGRTGVPCSLRHFFRVFQGCPHGGETGWGAGMCMCVAPRPTLTGSGWCSWRTPACSTL